MKNRILFAVATVALLSTVNTISASESVLSPRAKATQVRTASGVTEDKLARTIQAGTPKTRHFAQSIHKVPGNGGGIDLANGPRPNLAPKDPRFEKELRRLSPVRTASMR